ncbi:MAG: hypothetical protein H5T96_05950 [Tissierellales bacterium]|nr:hypothetical protein [Tissierellales bacterium]
MNKAINLTIKIILIILFFAYVSFMIIDIFYIDLYFYSNWIKFISIALIVSLSFVERKVCLSKIDINLLNIAMVLTLFADYFLLIKGSNYILGLAIFSVAHLFHGIRMHKDNTKIILIRFISFLIVVFILYSVFLGTPYEIDLIIFLSLFYFVNLISNLFRAFDIHKYNKLPAINSSLLVAGFTLFLLCDINVGLYNILSTNSSNIIFNILNDLSLRLIWFFYLPSQVFIVLSGLDFS